MRWAALADLHLGAGSDYGRSPGDRLRDQERVWVDVCTRLAETANLSPVIIAGDVFHRPRPTMGELAVYRHGLDILRQSGITVVVIAGNHDVSTDTEPTGMEILEGKGVVVMRKAGLMRVDGLQVACLPWAPLSSYVAARGGGDRDVAREEVARALVDIAGGMRAECEPGMPAILTLHWSVTGATTADGTPTSLFREVLLDARELEAQRWDAIYAGHIHRAQQITTSGAYCGSLTTVDFREATVPHGWWLSGLNDPKDASAGVYMHFQAVEDRPFVTIDARGYEDVIERIGELTLEEAVVRMRIDEGVDAAEVRRALYQQGAHKVYAVQTDAIRTDRVRVEEAHEQLDVPEALNLWIDRVTDMPADVAQAMRRRTAVYLDELK